MSSQYPSYVYPGTERLFDALRIRPYQPLDPWELIYEETGYAVGPGIGRMSLLSDGIGYRLQFTNSGDSVVRSYVVGAGSFDRFHKALKAWEAKRFAPPLPIGGF